MLEEGEMQCEHCGGDADSRCSQCRTAFYCSQKCQRAAWLGGHAVACHNNPVGEPSGLLVIAPCGAGKSTWLAAHPESGWIEGDDLYEAEGVAVGNFEAAEQVNVAAKKEGKKVLTSTWWTLDAADAVVLPDVAVLEERCALAPRPGNVPAAAVATLQAVMDKMETPPPVFDSIEKAVQSLEQKQ